MGTIITVLIIFYCIVVIFIMIEKKISVIPNSEWGNHIRNDETGNSDDDWLGFSAGFKSSPFLKNYDFPDD